MHQSSELSNAVHRGQRYDINLQRKYAKITNNKND